MISIGGLINRKQILLDIGSANTRLAVDGKILFDEPTCLAVHKHSNAVLAIGAKASVLLGKTPQNISVIFPVEAGKIANQQFAIRFIEALIHQLELIDFKASIVGLSGIAAIPSEISPVNRQVWKKVLKMSNFQSVELIENSRAISANLDQPQTITDSVCIVDIGAQKTDIAILSAGELVVAKTTELGGIECTQAIQTLLYKKYQFVVGWQSAEKCKREVACLPFTSFKPKTDVLNGKDAYQHIARTLDVSSEMFAEEMSRFAQKTITILKTFFSNVRPELAASSLQKGIYLTGGGSQLNGMAQFLKEELKTEVIVMPQPQLTTINGLAVIKSKNL